MLFVIYGLTLNVGAEVRHHLQSKGFRVVNKIVSENDNNVVKSYFVKRDVNEKEEIEKCDFNYKTNYGYVGFNNVDIFDAIYGKENALLAMTSDNIEFFHHIKTGYGDVVPIIATYIPENIQKEILDSNPQISKSEREKRLETGRMASKIILENRELFDEILIYGGENSSFNYEALKKQLDVIYTKALERQKEYLDKKYIQIPYQGNENYVFLSYSHKDRTIANEVLAFLQYNGIRVWYDAGIPVGDNWMNVIAEKIKKSTAIILLSSFNATQSTHVSTEIQNAFRFNKKIIKLNLDDSQFDDGVEMYFYGLNQASINVINYEIKASIIKTLETLDVVKK